MSFISKRSPADQTANNLGQYRRRKLRWWTIPLFVIVVLVGLIIWYSGVLMAAIDHATVKNSNPDSAQILKNSATGDSSTPVNILLIGDSSDRTNASSNGGDLSDSIMIASLDVKDDTISLLSIPRDLYVKIPGYGYNKINAAHALGDNQTAKTGGPALLEQTITQTLGIQIHYFMQLDFTGFQKLIDNVGGISINVPKAINDPLYPAADTIHYDPFYITAGLHAMNGATALKYARSRETTSDFDRSGRQQAIISALKDKILTPTTLANPTKVTGIISTLGSHILTDFSTSDIGQIAKIAGKLTNPKIRTFVLDTSTANWLKSSTSTTGADILIPKLGLTDYTDIQEFINGYFGAPPIIVELPTVSIYRGPTGTSAQVAKLQTLLTNAGFTVSLASTPGAETVTTITNYVNNRKPLSLNYLKTTYKATIVSGDTTVPATADYQFTVNADFDYKTIPTATPLAGSSSDPLSLKSSGITTN